MSDTTIARRYALALYQEAEAQEMTAAVDEALDMVGASLAGSHELGRFFESPVISRQKKQRIIERLFGDRVPALVLRLFSLLIDKGREQLVPAIVRSYRSMRNEQQNVLEAEARVPFALSDDEVVALEKAFTEATGKQVQLTVKEDASILGGVIVRVGDTVYDSSVRHQLGVLHEQLRQGSFLNN